MHAFIYFPILSQFSCTWNIFYLMFCFRWHTASYRGSTQRKKGQVATVSAMENSIFHIIWCPSILQRIGNKIITCYSKLTATQNFPEMHKHTLHEILLIFVSERWRKHRHQPDKICQSVSRCQEHSQGFRDIHRQPDVNTETQRWQKCWGVGSVPEHRRSAFTR